jgi:hypothetical protein
VRDAIRLKVSARYVRCRVVGFTHLHNGRSARVLRRRHCGQRAAATAGRARHQDAFGTAFRSALTEPGSATVARTTLGQPERAIGRVSRFDRSNTTPAVPRRVHKRTHAAYGCALRWLTIGEEITMLSTLLILLLVLWLLGVATSYTLGGFVHILLVIAIVVVLLRVIQGRNPLRG